MPVGNVDFSGGLGRGPGLGELAMLLARMATRGSGGGQPTAPLSAEAASGLGIPRAEAMAKPPRNYLGPDLAGAQALIQAMRTPPPERMPMKPGAPVPASKPMGTPMAGAGYKRGGKVKGKQVRCMAAGGPVVGPGDGRSDSVPAMIDGGQGMAQLSTDEYVIPADVVSAIGRGSSAAGAKQLDATVQQVRAGYAKSLGDLPGPKASKGKKGLGGLFSTEQDSQIELPDYIRDVAGSIPGRVKAFEQVRMGGASEVAKFTPDQLEFFKRTRQASNDPTGAGAALQRGQDLVGGIYDGGDPWSDDLIQQSLADYDRGSQIDDASRRRSAAGRGAFGEGVQLAEVEAGREQSRGRGLLGAQLREQGLTRRTDAAKTMADLAERERAANIGDVNLLGGIGEIEYGREQKIASAPWDRLSRINSLVQGAPTATSTTTSESPMKMILGAAAAAGGAAMAMKAGGRVRAGGRASHRKRAQKDGLYADGGAVDEPSPVRPALSSRQRAGRAVEGFGLDLMSSYADGGKVGPDEFRRIPMSKPSVEERARNAIAPGVDAKYMPPPGAIELSQISPANMEVRPKNPGMPKLAPSSGRSYGERLQGRRQSTSLKDLRPQTGALREQATALYSQALDKLIAQGLGLQDADRILMTALTGIDPNDYAAKNERLGQVLQDPRGYAGLDELSSGSQAQGFADGGRINDPELIADLRRRLDPRLASGWDVPINMPAPMASEPDPISNLAQTSGARDAVLDWFNGVGKRAWSGTDPITAAGRAYRGDAGALPPPYEREPSAADAATARARELAGAPVPDTTAPAPVSRPASGGGVKRGVKADLAQRRRGPPLLRREWLPSPNDSARPSRRSRSIVPGSQWRRSHRRVG